MQDNRGALLNYQEYIKRTPDPVSQYEVKKRIANIYYSKTGEIEKAIEVYEDLVKSHGDSLEADFLLYRIGMAKFRTNDFEGARIAYQRLLERFPKSHYVPQTRFEIGNTYYMESKYLVAIAALRQVLRHHPQSTYATEAQFLLGECYEQQGDVQSAVEVYEGLEGRYRPKEILQARIKSARKKLKKKRRYRR